MKAPALTVRGKESTTAAMMWIAFVAVTGKFVLTNMTPESYAYGLGAVGLIWGWREYQDKK